MREEFEAWERILKVWQEVCPCCGERLVGHCEQLGSFWLHFPVCYNLELKREKETVSMSHEEARKKYKEFEDMSVLELYARSIQKWNKVIEQLRDGEQEIAREIAIRMCGFCYHSVSRAAIYTDSFRCKNCMIDKSICNNSDNVNIGLVQRLYEKWLPDEENEKYPGYLIKKCYEIVDALEEEREKAKEELSEK